MRVPTGPIRWWADRAPEGADRVRTATMNDAAMIQSRMESLSVLVRDESVALVCDEFAPLPGGGCIFRISEDALGFTGAYVLHAQHDGRVALGQVLFMSTASGMRGRDAARALIDDLVRGPAVEGLDAVQFVARPPVDAYFRGLGARGLSIEAPWGDVTSPGIRLELRVVRRGSSR